MRKFVSLILAIICINQFTKGAEEARLMRFPAIHGDKITFSYGGDLYLVNSEGGMARRLTAHDGYEMFARFSPDGKQIAFTGQYDGNTEVFLMPSEGGIPERLTYTATLSRDDIGDRMGPNNIVMSWLPGGEGVVYRSRRYTGGSFTGALFKVSPKGGLSKQLPFSEAGWCSFSADGKKIAYNRVFREFRTWKYYKGGMADDIWIFDYETEKTINITNNDNQDIIPMWIGDEVYYISDRDRTMNLFVYNVKTKETKKVTDFNDYDIKFPSAGKDYIVFEKGGYIYKFDVKTKQSEKVNIKIANDAVYARPELKDVSKNIESADISPNGERVVFDARGDVFTVPAENGITRNLTNSSNANDHSVAWSPDGKYIAYISDRSGEFEVYIQKQDGSESPVQLTNGNKTYIFDISWSPDSKKIAYHTQDYRLDYVDIESKKVTNVHTSGIGRVDDYSWSPDSKWIAFTRPEKGMEIICLYNLQTKAVNEVTDMWFDSESPVFSTDGKYLFFTSRRNFKPTYSRTEWNHIYKDMDKIFFVTLSKDTKNPFAPENDEVKLKNEEGKKDDKKSDNSTSKDVKVDLQGIKDRVISLPVEGSNYFNLIPVDNKVYYLVYSGDGGIKTKYYDLKKKKETELGSDIILRLAAGGKKMLANMGNKYAVVGLPSGKIDFSEAINLDGLKKQINYQEEWAQVYDEAWRRMRDFFYARNMHGVDWNAMKTKYEVLVPYVKHRSDLTFIIGELIGELNVGHAYSANGEHPEPERIKTGLLGAKLTHPEGSFYKVDKVLEGANWNDAQRSPLTEVGVNVKEGDYILAVDGKSTKGMKNIYEALVNKADKPVELTVNSSPSFSGSRKVIVKPIEDESELYYYNWVKDNIKKVNEASNGEIGYIHIPDMGVNGLNRWASLYYPQLNKKALILDDRYNGGGNVSPMIIERLKRTVTYFTMHTNQKEGSVNPVGTFMGPKVALINGYSASDGDLFPYRFKYNKLGKVIGTRSWGGVVGYSGYIPFVDGGHIVTPSYAPYAADGSDFIIEGRGVEPDIILENDPYKEFKGIDDQLNRAVEELKKELKTKRQEIKPIPAWPDKSGN